MIADAIVMAAIAASLRAMPTSQAAAIKCLVKLIRRKVDDAEIIGYVEKYTHSLD